MGLRAITAATLAVGALGCGSDAASGCGPIRREALDSEYLVHVIDVDAPVEYVSDLYGGTPAEIFETIRLHVPEDASTVLVVGHFPGMPEAALSLDADGDIDRFPTSAYAVVSLSVPWDRVGLDLDGHARLVAFQVPR